MNQSQFIAYVNQRAPGYGLDPAAVLAVASQEGIGGGIGDGGTSFGPFQLHAGGALPANEYDGPYAQSTQNWAWSSDGVDYALGEIAGCASGLTGAAAVSAIVSCFERPANPAPEISGATNALAQFGGTIGSAVSSATTAITSAGASDNTAQIVVAAGAAILAIIGIGLIGDLLEGVAE